VFHLDGTGDGFGIYIAGLIEVNRPSGVVERMVTVVRQRKGGSETAFVVNAVCDELPVESELMALRPFGRPIHTTQQSSRDEEEEEVSHGVLELIVPEKPPSL
jgi:hypothetical protein